MNAQSEPEAETSVASAMRTLNTFDRAQVAWLMATAFRWGYEQRDAEDRGFWAGYQARVAEENAAWPPTDVIYDATSETKATDRVAHRRACDAAAGLRRPVDHAGGPVDWETGQPMREVAA